MQLLRVRERLSYCTTPVQPVAWAASALGSCKAKILPQQAQQALFTLQCVGQGPAAVLLQKADKLTN